MIRVKIYSLSSSLLAYTFIIFIRLHFHHLYSLLSCRVYSPNLFLLCSISIYSIRFCILYSIPFSLNLFSSHLHELLYFVISSRKQSPIQIYNTTSRHIILYHIISCHIISCQIISHHIVSNHIISYHIILSPSSISTYHTLSNLCFLIPLLLINS